MITHRFSLSSFLYLVSALFSATFYAGPLTAGNNAEQNLARSALASGEAIPFAAVQARLTEECRCQILEAKLHIEKKHDTPQLIYDIKAITPGGRIIKLEMDARTGGIVSMKNKGWKN